jgi:hypothetical protein
MVQALEQECAAAGDTLRAGVADVRPRVAAFQDGWHLYDV